MKKHNILVIGTTVLVGAFAALVIQRQALARFRDNDAAIQQQELHLLELMIERQELSNRVARANHRPAGDQQIELARLRREVEALESQARELERQAAGSRRAKAGSAATAGLKPRSGFRGSGAVFSETRSKEYDEQLFEMATRQGDSTSMGDAKNLMFAVRRYAAAHEGQFPRTFDEASPYVYTGKYPLAGTRQGRDPMAGINDFELVYQGSLNELTNIPMQAVAVIRQRNPWPTPAGKSARIYIMAASAINVVESSDQFQSWEKEHLIPPP